MLKIHQTFRYLYTCKECPDTYPWIKNEFGTDFKWVIVMKKMVGWKEVREIVIALLVKLYHDHLFDIQLIIVEVLWYCESAQVYNPSFRTPRKYVDIISYLVNYVLYIQHRLDDIGSRNRSAAGIVGSWWFALLLSGFKCALGRI